MSHLPTAWLQLTTSMLDVEQPLVQGQLEAIDAQLRRGEDSVNWNSQGQRMRQGVFFFNHDEQIMISNICASYLKCLQANDFSCVSVSVFNVLGVAFSKETELVLYSPVKMSIYKIVYCYRIHDLVIHDHELMCVCVF